MAKDKKAEEKAIAAHVSGQSNKPISAPAHALAFDSVASELGADIQNGLSHEEAKKRLEEFGRNEFGENKGVQPARILVAQIANALTLVSNELANLFHPNPVMANVYLEDEHGSRSGVTLPQTDRCFQGQAHLSRPVLCWKNNKLTDTETGAYPRHGRLIRY